MALTLQQRLGRLQVRLDELTFWRDRAYFDLHGWTCNGVPLDIGQAWPEREGVVTFALSPVTVPDDWPLEDVLLDLNLGGEGLLSVRYTDGSRQALGLDPFHRRFPLCHREFSVEAQTVARYPFGVPNRDARLEWARLVLIDRPLDIFIRRLILLLEAARTLVDQEVAVLLAEAGERAVEMLDWPSATEPYLSRVRESPQMLDIWSLPPGLEHHPRGLNEEQRQSVEAANELLERELVAQRAGYPHQGRAALTGQAHLDLAWLWPMEETRRKAQRTCSTVLSLMERDPNLTFHLTSAQVYAFLEQDDPTLFARIRESVASGRWEPIGGMWVEPDLNMPAGESLVRQLLYGQRFFERVFGKRHNVAWLPDCFGFTAALPQLLLGAGIENFFTVKVNWSETNIFPFDLFWWEGLDGSRVLAHTFNNPGPSDPGYDLAVQDGDAGTGGYNGNPGPYSLVSTWRSYRGKTIFQETLFSMGYGDGGGGPNAEMVERVPELDLFPVVPALRYTRVDDFYRRAREAIGNRRLPVWVGELYLELHRGTLTTQGRTKYLHRRAERALVAAEVLSGMNALLGHPKAGTREPESLEPHWQVVLRNEFHDILPGSSIREVYERTEAELTDVVQHSRAVIDTQLGELMRHLVPEGEQEALLAVNPELSPRPLRIRLDHPFPGAQEVEGGSVLTGAQNVPGLGAAVVLQHTPPSTLSVSPTHLENDFLRVTLAPDGSLIGVWDKRARREALSGRGNQLWAFVDKPRVFDAWEIDEGYSAQGEEITQVESCRVSEHGPHRAAIRIERRFRHSRIVQDLRLWANSARLEFRTTLDWHDRHWLLKARFPLAIRTSYATFETAFGVIQRSTHRNTSWDEARFEVAGHRFADLSEPGYGVALLNDGKYGHDVLQNAIGLSLLRSPAYPDPLADEGMQAFTYALYPHRGSWLEGGVLMEAEDLNSPLLALPCRARAKSSWQALRLEGLPLGLGSLKVREDRNGLVFRTYEPQGARGEVRLELPDGWTMESELNLLEDPIGSPDLTFAPFQVHSWLLRKTH